MVSAKKNEVVYLYKCRQCTVTLPDKTAKLIVGTLSKFQFIGSCLIPLLVSDNL